MTPPRPNEGGRRCRLRPATRPALAIPGDALWMGSGEEGWKPNQAGSLVPRRCLPVLRPLHPGCRGASPPSGSPAVCISTSGNAAAFPETGGASAGSGAGGQGGGALIRGDLRDWCVEGRFDALQLGRPGRCLRTRRRRKAGEGWRRGWFSEGLDGNRCCCRQRCRGFFLRRGNGFGRRGYGRREGFLGRRWNRWFRHCRLEILRIVFGNGVRFLGRPFGRIVLDIRSRCRGRRLSGIGRPRLRGDGHQLDHDGLTGGEGGTVPCPRQGKWPPRLHEEGPKRPGPRTSPYAPAGERETVGQPSPFLSCGIADQGTR